MTDKEAIEALTDKDVVNPYLTLEALEIAIDALKERAERKTGKWIKDKYGTDHCSCCDYIPAYDTAIDDIYYSPYCPNCGAKMEVDE